ncbi:MAG: Thioredoxin reductase [uncultured Frankineae bacterium]|uniref:Thioredoxin reductase n=1 Tax=uncultured Frankineae bacterium TaxID=437475 RepID=A0A6J4LMH1_9ACTN|nr:MAG: Thioredoxin reductase [uncultured Frankineae bacterium]
MTLPGGPERLEVDVVVVGGGASGLAAASWIGRYRRSVVVIDSQDHRNQQVECSHGYLGRDPQKPADLIAKGREEVLAYPTAQIRFGRVTHVERRPDGLFDVGDDLLAHRLVLACGVKDAFPDVEDFFEHYGASVFHCPACDGYEARDRHVVALGWDPHLVGFASTLQNWACSVTVVTNGRRFRGDDSCRTELATHDITLREQNAVRFLGERGDLRGVELEGGEVLPASMVMFSVAHVPRTDLAEMLGCRLDEEGYVAVSDCGETSVPGVYAAGDLTPGLQLTLVAAASGVVAGVGASQSMFGERGAPTSPEPAPAVG